MVSIMNKKKVYKQFDKENIVQEGFNVYEEYANWIEDRNYKLSNMDSFIEEKEKIPHITHLIYLSNNKNPTPIKSYVVDIIFSTCQRLNNEDPNFKHFFWTNNPNIVPEKLLTLPNIEIKLVNEFKGTTLWKNFDKTLNNAFKSSILFPQASDIMRLMAVQKYGGIYHDLDYEIYNASEIVKYTKAFNFFDAKEHSFWDTFVGNAFIAASPNHPIINTAVELVHRNLNPSKVTFLPEYVARPYSRFEKVLFETGPVMLTIAYYKANNQDGNNDMVFPWYTLYNYPYARAINKGSKCYTDMDSKDFEEMSAIVVGADLFCGEWSNPSPITYLD